MFGCRIGFPQQYPFSPDVHPCISDEGEFCVYTKHRYGMEVPPSMAVLDTHGWGTIMTQQLSNSATQQLSNSATQQLSNSATRLCPDKRAAFIFSQQHHYFFSSIFADGKRTVNLFPIKPQRVPRMRSQIERRVDKDIPSKTLPFSASFAGALRKRIAKHIPYSQDSSINFVSHNYTLCIINYPLFSAFYRRSRPAVWFDSG